MNPQISPKTIQRGLWTGALLLAAVAAQAQTTVTFQVDMTDAIANSQYYPATETVAVTGTLNGWSTAAPLTNNPAAANPNLYSGTYVDSTDANGKSIDYKYLIVSNGNWTYGSTADSDNYCITLPANGGSLVLPISFWDDDGTPVANAITFQVDMAEQAHLGTFDPSTMNVYGQGYFEGWSDTFQLTNNVADNVTNNGIISSMPYVGTYTTWSASPGAANSYKFVYNNGGDNYENPTSGDPDNGQNRGGFNVAGTLPLVNFSDVPFSATVTNNVTFIIDMSVQAAVGNFNAANGSTVELHGDYNGWGGGTTMTNSPNDSDTNHYYLNYQYIAGQGSYSYFKYVIQPGTQWENIGGSDTIGGNRYLIQEQGAHNAGPVYFSDQGPDTLPDFVLVTNCMVTFTVDMSDTTNASYTGNNGGPFIIGFDDVYLNGLNGGINNSFWTWGSLSAPPQYEMTEVPNDGESPIYQITLPVNLGQNINLTYKYSIDANDDEAGFNDNHMRYIRSSPNYSMPTDIFGSQGNGTSSEISFGNFSIAKSGGNVSLTWLGRPGVRLQSTTSLVPPITWTQLPLTDGTNLIVTQGPGTSPPVGYASTNYPASGPAKYFELIGPP